MNMAMAGALQGAGTVALDYLKQRDADQAELEKQEMLSRLRYQQELEKMNYEAYLDSTKINDKLTQRDPIKGTITYRSNRGNVIGTDTMTDADKQDYQLDVQKKQGDIANTQSQIGYRGWQQKHGDAELGISRSRLGLEQARFARDGRSGGSGGMSLTDVPANATPTQAMNILGDRLLSATKFDVQQARSAGVPPAAIDGAVRATLAGVGNGKLSIDQASSQFKQALSTLINTANTRDKQGKLPSWSIPTGARRLDNSQPGG